MSDVVRGSDKVKPIRPAFEDSVRDARLAEAAHLDALIRSQDAGALRLDHLRSRLLDSLPGESPLRQSMDLRLPPDFPARLFLDLVRSVAIASDGRSYVLEQDSDQHRMSLATTSSAEDMVQEILRLEAHASIRAARKAVQRHLPWAKPAARPFTPLQLLLIWLSGFLAGGMGLLIISMLLKSFHF